jgi:hypothetical protein
MLGVSDGVGIPNNRYLMLNAEPGMEGFIKHINSGSHLSANPEAIIRYLRCDARNDFGVECLVACHGFNKPANVFSFVVGV